MRIRIKRVDTTLPLPEYQTNGSVAFDIYARETTPVEPDSLAKIPSNLIIETPAGYALIIASRSSLAGKKGLMLANGIGIIDQDYSGEQDELLISVYNFTSQSVTVERGDRIAQGLFVPVEKAVWNEQTTMKKESRGGFGSTGEHTQIV